MARANTYQFVTDAPSEQLEAVLQSYQGREDLSGTERGVQHVIGLVLEQRAHNSAAMKPGEARVVVRGASREPVIHTEVGPAPRWQLLKGGRR